jgi:hypothetical protein
MSKNRFGGIAGSNYTPMSEDEQEVLNRLIATRDMDVFIKGWGFIKGVEGAIAGDLRLAIPIIMDFDRPEIPMKVFHFDLELRTSSGILLFKERQSTMYNGQPLLVSAGTHLSMIWDIGIRHMDPKIVKAYKPGASGLTSRWQDRDTGDMTLCGNTRMGADDRKALTSLRKAEIRSKAISAASQARNEAAAKTPKKK